MILGLTLENHPVSIDLDRLVEGRLMLQANSGAGKSWALRRLLEQTHGKIQHIVVDVEDEFHTLREKYDYILAGRDGGDCPADRRSAELLARRLLELGMSAVISIYEMRPDEREEFVRIFLEALVSAPRSLWHPALVIIDEAHMFAPEGGKSETTGAVVDLMARGRKRGFAGVLATQRISKINKDAIAECNNKLIGRAALDTDMKRSADELGFSSKDRQLYLRTLPAGRFFAFGPALSLTVVEMEVGPVVTTHPKAGQRSAPPTPPPNKVKAVLEQLANLPHEAEAEAKTAEDLRRKLRTLEGELRKAQRPGLTEEEILSLKKDIAAAELRGRELASREWSARLQSIVDEKLDIERDLVQVSARLNRIGELAKAMAEVAFPVPAPVYSDTPLHKNAGSSQRIQSVHQSLQTVHNTKGLSGPEQRILDAIAWMESIGIDSPEQTAVAFLADYTYGGGAFNNPRGSLRVKGLIEYAGDCLRLTSKGRGLARTIQTPLTTAELHGSILRRLPGPEQKILKVILERFPKSVSNEECAIRAGYTPDGGAYNNPRGRLRSLGLIEYPERGHVRARNILFLD